jgi:hypothetical protein
MIATLRGAVGNLTPVEGEPARIAGVFVTHDYFRMLGMEPLIGRGFTAAEDRPGGAQVVILGESLWRGRYAADPAVLGRTIRLNEADYQVIGVMPDGTDFGLDQLHARADYHAQYLASGPIDVWLPNAASAEAFSRDTHPFLVLGRLAPDATLDAARDELASITADLEQT